MLHALNQIYSWPFFFGAVGGLSVQRLYRCCEAWYGNRYHPRDDGRKYRVGGINRVWLAGLIAALTIGYILLSAEKARQQTIELNHEVARCWSEGYRAAKDRAVIADEDAKLAKELQDRRDDLEAGRGDWYRRLLEAPANIGDSIERREQYVYDVTKVHAERQARILAKIAELQARQADLEVARQRSPLPELTCGR